MKKRIILAMLLSGGTLLKAQNKTVETSSRNMLLARACIDAGTLHYNPEKAFGLFMGEAEKGNAQAMNAVGLQYSRGLGTAINLREAVNWFERAGKAGYSSAYNNLGYIYKEGLGVGQDFAKAMSYFRKGAEMEDRQSIYMTGYLQYKGLGTEQDYDESVKQFKKASQMGNVPAMYFLGLSFRNGYGVTADADSARHWLNLAMAKGNRQAINELTASEPEYVPTAEKNKMAKSSEENSKWLFQDIASLSHSQKSSAKDQLAGFYTGYILRYDWSGKHIIGRSALALRLNRTGKELEGLWTEDGAISTQLKAVLTDSVLLFNGSSYSKKNHYRPNGELLEFRDASLKFAEKNDTARLEGSVRLWSPSRNEPGKPAYISLTRIQADDLKPENNVASTLNIDVKSQDITDSGLKSQRGFSAYPNPFNNNLQVSFVVEKTASVNISLISMNGTVMITDKTGSLSVGNHVRTLRTEKLPTGSYILRLESNGVSQTTLVIKN